MTSHLSRMKYRQKELNAYFEGSLLPGTVEPSLRARHPEILSKYSPHNSPGWVVSLRCSHKPDALFRWLVSKKVLGFLLNQGERLLIYHLGLPDRNIVLLQTLLREKDTDLVLRLSRQRFAGNSHLVELNRILHGYRPSVLYDKEWKPQKLPPVRRIGVGYKDKGTLGSGLSWKDQILPEEGPTSSMQNEFNLKVLTLLGMGS